jgi:uncharacterized protein YacL
MIYLIFGIMYAIIALVILVFAVIMCIQGDNCIRAFSLFIILTSLSVVFFYKSSITPEKKLESLLKEKMKIEQRIEHFYIDHPDFKEIKE